jgi:hypothetical protein
MGAADWAALSSAMMRQHLSILLYPKQVATLIREVGVSAKAGLDGDLPTVRLALPEPSSAVPSNAPKAAIAHLDLKTTGVE